MSTVRYPNQGGNANSSVSASYASTASIALLALTASLTITSQSIQVFSSSSISSSWASQSLSSSFSTTANNATSASYALTASYAANGSGNSVSSSFATTASAATSITFIPLQSTSASYALTASYAQNAQTPVSVSYASNAGASNTSTSASYAATASIVLGSISTASLALQAITASYISGSGVFSGSFTGSITSASYALTASFALNGGGGSTATASFAITASVAQAALGIIRLGDSQWQPWIADGITDCTPTIRAALASASLPQWSNQIIVGSEPINNASGYGVLVSASANNPLIVNSNIALHGDGGSATLITIATGSYINSPNNQSLSVFNVDGGNTEISNIEIDGQRNAVGTIAAVTQSLTTIGIYVVGSNCLVDTVNVTNLYGIPGGESFGIMFAGAASASMMTNCVASFMSGTGFHDAANLGGGNNRIINCEGHDLGWHGASVFNTNQSQVQGNYFYNNAKCGINVEEATDVQVFGNDLRNNGEAGVQIIGFCSYLSVVGNVLKANNTRFGGNGEITVFTGDGQGLASTMYIANNVITPIDSVNNRPFAHVESSTTIGSYTTGSSMGGGILDAANVADYVMFSQNNPQFTLTNWQIPSLRNSWKTLTTGTFPIPNQWTPVGISGSIPVNLGTSSSFAYKVTATTGSAAFTTPFFIPSGRRVLIHSRLNPLDSGSGWQLSLQDATNTYAITRFGSGSNDTNMWYASDVPVSISSSAGPCRLNLNVYNFQTTSSLVIDHIDVKTGPYIGNDIINDNTFLLGVSSSYALVAQNVLGSITSASYALTASFAQNGGGGSSVSSSYAVTASYASIAQNVLGSITSASYALTASYATVAQNVLGSITSASFAQTASVAQLVTVISQSIVAPFILNPGLPGFYYLSPGTASLSVSLPTHSLGLNYTVKNISNSGTITILDTNRVTQSVALYPGMFTTLIDDSTNWNAH